ncbi:MAG: LLM class F420-dependent oxidoreductase, partial [Myxococcales bacterium]|nr:LLM class F420-dependent oxidoreductase [Myxococcales bacterium]
MRFSYAESMIEPSQLFTLAIEAEQAGFTSFTV